MKKKENLSFRGIKRHDKKLIPYKSKNIKRSDVPRCKRPKDRNASLSRLLQKDK